MMFTVPATVPGPDNDLADKLDHFVARAAADPAARVYAFGQRWGPEQGTPDKVFGFAPSNGIHDIHMNQGNSQSQARHTDDQTGHAIGTRSRDRHRAQRQRWGHRPGWLVDS
jgi:uncharacterized protein YukJ